MGVLAGRRKCGVGGGSGLMGIDAGSRYWGHCRSRIIPFFSRLINSWLLQSLSCMQSCNTSRNQGCFWIVSSEHATGRGVHRPPALQDCQSQ